MEDFDPAILADVTAPVVSLYIPVHHTHIVLGAVLEVAQKRLDEVGVAGGHHGIGGELM